MVVNADRQSLISHNIANLETPGFKQVLMSVQEFVKTPVTYSPGNLTRSGLNAIGSLGLGSMDRPRVTDFTQGNMQLTSNPLDVAIEGDGFFRIKTPTGEAFTRDGRFLRSSTGALVTFQGYAVLNQAGQPIQLPDGVVGIAPDGTVSVENKPVGQIGVSVFADPKADLTPTEGNYFTAKTAAPTALPNGKTRPMVAQGYLEMSNANSTQLMAQLVEVSRSYEAAQQMVQNQDELLGKTIASLGTLG